MLCKLNKLIIFRRYKRYYHISCHIGIPQNKLAKKVEKHFNQLSYNKDEVIANFIQKSKMNEKSPESSLTNSPVTPVSKPSQPKLRKKRKAQKNLNF